MLIKEFDTVILENGMKALVAAVINKDTYMVHVEDYPDERITLQVTLDDIDRVVPADHPIDNNLNNIKKLRVTKEDVLRYWEARMSEIPANQEIPKEFLERLKEKGCI